MRIISLGSGATRLGLGGILTTVALVLHSGHQAGAQAGAMRWDGLLEGVSVQTTYFGSEPVPGDGPSRVARHAVSADGRYVLFNSEAVNLNFSQPALYLRDRNTGETRLLLGGPVQTAVLSADGNHMAFVVCDPYMHPGTPEPICDVYAIDLRTWLWTAISATADGTLGDADSLEPVLSSDGRFVAFRTNATNLLPPGAAPGQIVFRDRDPDGNGIYDEPGTTLTETVSISVTGEPGDGPSETPELSDDGRYVAFRSSATNLVASDTNGVRDVFLHDRLTGETRRINIRPEGQQSTSSIDSPAISMTPDGRYIAFSSADGLLAPGFPDDTNNTLDVFVYDALGMFLTRLDVGWGPPIAGGYVPGNGRTQWPSFSADGRYVALQSEATNTEVPNPTGFAQVYVYDRVLQKPTRVSIKPDGTDPNIDSCLPQISADGSAVVFVSPATNILNGVPLGVNEIYAAVHLAVTPAEVTVPGRGGSASFAVTAQQHTRWWATWDWSQYWFGPDIMPPFGTGDGTMSFAARYANPDPAPRSIAIRLNNAQEVTFTQETGLSLSSVSPASGPMDGGTQVTVHGTGFEPDTRVVFDGHESAATEFVDSTTIIATTPPHAAGTVWVAVFSSDYRSAWIDQAFHYVDTTPPLIYPFAYGDQGLNGWFNADVYVSFYVTDPDSAITSLSGCDYTVVNTDTAGTTFTCTATSEGGTTTVSTSVKRDATPPGGITRAPLKDFLYKRFTVVTTDYVCGDSTSGVASCVGPVPNGAYLNTGVPGGHYTFDVQSEDRAGNRGGMSTPYAVSSAVCEPRPSGLIGWWPGDGHYRDIAGGHDGAIANASPIFTSSPYSMAMVFVGSNFLIVPPTPSLEMHNAFTLSAWVYIVRDWLNSFSVIAGREGEYLLARGPNGNLQYSIANTNPGWGWVDTGIRLDRETWTKVALTYDGSEIRLYKNGQVLYIRTAGGEIGDVAPALNEFRIAARQDPAAPSYFDGGIGDVEVVDRAMSLVEIDNAYLSADFGLCSLPTVVQLTPSPQRVTYGPSTANLVATLTESGNPVANERIDFTFRNVSAGYGITDANGVAQIAASIAGMNAGTYVGAVQASHPATAYLRYATTSSDFVIDKATPIVTWNTPAPITYGTAIGGAELNATATVAGSFVYSPASGAIVGAGPQTLSVTFHPLNSTNYANATASVTLTVLKATPTVSVVGGSFTYDASAHAATGSVTGVGGASLGTPTFTYNGSADTPIDAGSYDVVASYAGDSNYSPASGTATITIGKATPTVTVNGGTFTYDAVAHPATGSVTGVGGASVGTPTFAYNGSPDAPVNAGSYDVVGSYGGSANYNAATGTATITIGKATPTVAVSGGSFTYDSAAHPATGSVTGVGGATLSPLTFTYNGSGSAPVNAGTYDVVGSYAGDLNYESASGTATITIGKETPSLSWTRPAAIVYGTALGAGQLNAAATVAGTFNYSPGGGTVLAAGAGQPLSAVFTPTDPANYLGGSIATTIDVVPAGLTVRANDAAKPFGAPLPGFTATFTGFVNGDTPASLGGTLGFATTATVNSAVGVYPVVPGGVSASNYTIAFVAGTLSIVRSSVLVGVGTSPEPSGLDQPMTFVASVAAAPPGAGSPTGIVRFFDGTTLLGSSTVSGGAASLTTAGLDTGAHVIEARYDGDGSFDIGANSSTHNVATAADTPSVTLTSSRNPSNSGQSVTFTANVSLSSGSVAGVVEFYDAGTLIGSSSIAAGRATLTTTALAVGSHAMTARYAGIAGVPPSLSGVLVQAVAGPSSRSKSTTLALTALPNPAALATNVDLVATVNGSISAKPTGRVLFMIDGVVVGNSAGEALAPLSGSNARATLTVSGLAHGRHKVTATYLGDLNYKGSTGAVTETVN